ncbi:hypothetical protein E8E13_000617 [Curvularia kusanoi]|uniref:Glucose-methanol-choline oxidoreductase N-terminal domain-containing protein n=1 Tax=Curvularia kusanoi TaxID=90978 RepID=A0A9P4T3S0_CURKU|nr:hypothetical protein E8E13_000617 [Curvularia kusanoi]
MTTYDFIVVGSGPAGCALASKLARTNSRPTVLLIEAGENHPETKEIPYGQRWQLFQKPDLNWGYQTVPQEHCYERQLDYSRGKCLGGSSVINFGAYTVGCRDDFEEWARIVDDDHFGWDKMQKRFKDLETFHDAVPVSVNGRKYAAPNLADHGSTGPLHVGFAPEWERDVPLMMDAFAKAGHRINPDHNSGNPLGISISIKSVRKGIVSSAQDLIWDAPENLSILLNHPVQRVLYDQNRVVGAESNGKRCRVLTSPITTKKLIKTTLDLASKEVILSAGALNTPHILMHSGIGPSSQLAKFGIPIVHHNDAVGQGLRDHFFFSVVLIRKDGSTDRKGFYGDQKAMDIAQKQWDSDRTGPWTVFGCEQAIGWFKSDEAIRSHEFKALPVHERAFLERETVPHFETFANIPIHWFMEDFPPDHPPYTTLTGFPFNAQSRGEVILQSSDPDVPLLFDPKVFAHPFDRRMAIITLRSLLRVAHHPDFKKDTIGVLAGPDSESDSDLLEYCKRNVASTWHMCGTAKMGIKQDGKSVVGSDFCVFGVNGLRIADLSITPILPNCHTQSTGYAIGTACAEKLIDEYSLNESSRCFLTKSRL